MKKSETAKVLASIESSKNTMNGLAPNKPNFIFLQDMEDEIREMKLPLTDHEINAILCMMILYKDFHVALNVKQTLESFL